MRIRIALKYNTQPHPQYSCCRLYFRKCFKTKLIQDITNLINMIKVAMVDQ
jgi:hypothetical protein